MRKVDKSKFIFGVFAVVKPNRLIALRVNLSNDNPPNLPTITGRCDPVNREGSLKNPSAATERHTGIWLVI